MGASTVTLSVLLVCLILSSTSTEDLQGGDPEKDEFEDYELDDLDIDEATREKQQWERVLKDQRDSGVQVEIIEESKECSRYSNVVFADHRGIIVGFLLPNCIFHVSLSSTRMIEGVGEKVAYHYRGYFPDTNKDFDTSFQRGSPWRFQVWIPIVITREAVCEAFWR